MPVINEVSQSTTGTDVEYIEIFDAPNTDLSDLTLLVIEGSISSSQTGQIRTAISVGTTDAQGFFLANLAANTLQNDNNSYLLVRDFTGAEGDFIDGTDGSDADGTLNGTLPFAEVVDSVSLADSSAAGFHYSTTVLEPGLNGNSFEVGGASRVVDGVDTDTVADWARNNFNLAGIDGSATAAPGEAENTPGAANVVIPAVVVEDPVPTALTIPEIQGATHVSTHVGVLVITTGIVTALESNGFYLQDAVGDGNTDTSDGIFVSTGGAPSVAVGDEAEVTGNVTEFIPGGASTGNLSITQITQTEAPNVLSSGNALPAATVIGQSGRTPPTDNVIDDAEVGSGINLQDPVDAAANNFDPSNDGIDFYESLEGMRVTVEDAVAVSATSRFGEIFVTANQGAGQGPFNDRGGIQLQPDDENPERIQLQIDSNTSPTLTIDPVNVGDTLGDVTGVVDYNFGNFEVKITDETVTVTDGGLEKETTNLVGTDTQMTVASYNVLNLDPSDGAQFDGIAGHIVDNLQTPDVIALQEIQDNNGTATGELSSDVTLQTLVDAIAAAGGPTYTFEVVDPVAENAQGGQPGGNIRVAYLYNDARVDLVPGSVRALDESTLTAEGVSVPDAFNGSRIPLEAQFTFQGETVTVINNHFSSKFGSTPIFGGPQPFVDAGRDARINQAQAINDLVSGKLADDPDAKVVVVGDLNDFDFSDPIATLKGAGDNQVLFNQIDTIPEFEDRFTFNFQGNSQVLDHILVTDSLQSFTEFDAVHVNTEFADASSDHEPIIARITVNPAPPEGTGDVNLVEVGGFTSTGAEIVAHDPSTDRLYVTNGTNTGVDVLDISDPSNPTPLAPLVLPVGLPADDVTSVAVNDSGIVAVAVPHSDGTLNGSVVLFDASGAVLNTIEVGVLPDSVSFSPDGTLVLVANEGEPAGGADPEGSISIINIAGGAAGATSVNLDFTAFNGQEDALRDAGVRIFPGKSVAEDLEPEFISVSPDGTQAFVTLQENNAIAVVELTPGAETISELRALGTQDFSTGGGLDPSDRDGTYAIRNAPVQGLFMPDAIASYTVNGTTFYVTANEGDARDEDVRIKDLTLDPTAFPDAADLQRDEVLGRLQASSIDGDTDGDGDIDELFVYGSRSFTIWNADTGEQVFDSGDDFARILADVLPTDAIDNVLEGRSDNKGSEPEGVTVGEIDGETYAFIGLERASGVMVYNVTDPANAQFVSYLDGLSTGDIGPEGLAFISAADSPNGKPHLAVTYEVSNTTKLFELSPPENFKLQILHASDLEGGVDAIGRAPNFAAIVDHLEDTFENSLTISAGDNFISGPFFSASGDRGAFRDSGLLNDVYNDLFGLTDEANDYDGLREGSGRVDIGIMNIIGFDASALGNHEFDLGTAALEDIINPEFRGDGLGDDRNVGSLFPYLSSNLDFSNDGNLGGLATTDILDANDFVTGPDESAAGTTTPRIAPAVVVEEGGEKIGIVGATTPLLQTISSPGDTTVVGPTSNDMAALAAVIQPVIDQLQADGINKIILTSHLQQISLETELAGLLSGVDVIIAGGSDTLLADSNDTLRDGDVAADTYPVETTNADGDPVVIVSTDGEYSYVGRLVLEFDDNGVLVAQDGGGFTDEAESGVFATTDATVTDLFGAEDPFAENSKGELVSRLVDAVEDVVTETDGNVFGFTNVFLNGSREDVRTQETNFGNLTADANLAAAQGFDETVVVSIKNGGGIRAPIGEITGDPANGFEFAPPQPNPLITGSVEGEVSQLDIENSLRFNNGLTLITLTAAQLKETLEHAVSASEPGATPGQFPQVGGLSFSFDLTQAARTSNGDGSEATAGERVRNVSLLDENGEPFKTIVEDGVVVDPDMPIRVVTLNFLAGAFGFPGDGYPFQSFANADPDFANQVELTDALAIPDGETDTSAATFAAPGSEQDALAEFLAANHATQETAFDAADTGAADDTRLQNLDEVAEDTVLPEPFTLQILHASDLEGGVDAIGRAPNFAAIVDHLEDTFDNSLTISAGDNFISGPFFSASGDRGAFRDSGLLNDVYNDLFGLTDEANDYDGLREGSGRVDIGIMNIIGFDASALGNHEFDLGTAALEDIINPEFRGDGLGDDRNVGSLFPYLSSNLDFSNDGNLGGLATTDILDANDFVTGPDESATGTTTPRIAPAVVVEEGGEKIGIVGATTPLLQTISSPGDTTVVGPTSNDMAALAAVIQPVIDQLQADGINKIILTSHLQQISLETELAGLLSGVDVIIAGGSDTLLADSNDTLRDGDVADDTYPVETTNADGDPVVIVSTDGEYSYVGRLVLNFDENGVLIENEGGGFTDEAVSGAFATTDQTVTDLFGAEDAFAQNSKGELVTRLVDAVEDVVTETDGNVFGFTDVFLNGSREDVRTQETNFGNLTADANLAAAQGFDETVVVSIKNGGGIRAPIGEITGDPASGFEFAPPQPNPLIPGSVEGEVSQLDIENSLRFNNGLSLITLTAAQLKETLEHAVSASEPGATPGQFPQVGGMAFSFDLTQTARTSNGDGSEATPGERVQSIVLLDEDGEPTIPILVDGEFIADPDMPIRVVTLNFLAGAFGFPGDGYPFQSFANADPDFANQVELTQALAIPDGETDNSAATFAAPGSEQDALAEFLAANHASPEDAFTVADTGAPADTRIQNLAEVPADTVVGDLVEDLTDGDDREVGDDDDNFIDGGEGNDIIAGGDGDDGLLGGDDNDQLFGEDGDDNLNGGDGNDRAFGGDGDDNIDGGAGDDDLLRGGDGDDNIKGGDGDDRIFGDDGDDDIDGGNDDDVLLGGDGNDDIDGGEGDDRLVGGAGEDDLNGGDGRDDLRGQSDDDTLKGGADDDRLSGGDGDDDLDGEEGNDVLSGGDGDDDLDGGDGSDKLFGDDGDDKLNGGSGSDQVFGGDGDDEIDGGDGDDNLLSGGDGDDDINGGDGDDRIFGDDGDDDIDGGDGDDNLLGGDGNDDIDGGDGDDRLIGGAGEDDLDGGDGRDDLRGQDGNDALSGGAGDDRVNGGDGEDDIDGDDGNDTLLGGDDNDDIDGGDGNDLIFGGDGDDLVNGGDGNDAINGGDGNDTVDYSTSGQVRVDLAAHSAKHADSLFNGNSAPAMVNGLGGFQVEAVHTVGETLSSTGALNDLNNPEGDYTPVGIMDGIGAFSLNEETVRVFVNHELLHFRGNDYSVSDGNGGTFDMSGARISYFDFDKETKQIVDSGLAYNTIVDANGDVASDTSFLPEPFAAFFGGTPGNGSELSGFSRFCSGILHEGGEFGDGRGIVDTIYFAGEEDGSGFNSVGGAEWALDVETGTLYQVPDMGRGAWENITQVDTGTDTHVAFILADDSSPFDSDGDGENEAAPLFLYVGEKDTSDGAEFLARNGLDGGKLYVWVADEEGIDGPANFAGAGSTAGGSWVEVDNTPNLEQASEDGSTGFDEYGYPTQSNLWNQAETLGAFRFSRPEDVATNPEDGAEFVLASTGVDTFDVDPITGNGADTFGTMYTMQLDFSDINNPGGTLNILYDGDEDTENRALRSPDNLDWADDGFIYVQEDEAEEDTLSGDEVLFGEGAVNPNEAGIVRIDPATGEVERVANIDRSVILDPTTSGQPFDTDAGRAGEWETSGILDVSSLFGEDPGSLFLFDVQAHGIEDQTDVNEDSRINDGDLVEGGQLAFLSAADEDEFSDRLNDVENVIGSNFNDTISGDDQANILHGGLGNDILTGRGAEDTFRFDLGDGFDIVTDFEAGSDTIAINGLDGVTSAELLANNAEQVEADTVITLNDGLQSITLIGVQLDDLSESDFDISNDDLLLF